MYCSICQTETEAPPRFPVRSNVRAFATESFDVWRCPACQSIHACDEVDLAHYYARYPFHDLGDGGHGWMLRAMYRNMTKRMVRAGVDQHSAILDYGCGAGLLLGCLKQLGFEQAFGYDAYTEAYSDPATLERSYDCVVTQDVIEHVDDPMELVQTLHQLTRPGGVILIGTPNAEDIDLDHPETRMHSLHQPYHRHILSRTALRGLGSDLGWELLHTYDEMYSNTPLPFVNAAFLKHYFACFDDTADLAVEPLRVDSWRLYTPKTLFRALFGYWFPPKYDVMVTFRRP